MRWGIRARITAVAALAVLAVLAVAAAVLVTTQRRVLTGHLDDTLSTLAAELAESLHGGPVADPLLPRGDDDGIAQVTAGDTVVAATANYRGRPALPPPPPGPVEAVRTVALLPGEPEFRVVSRRAGDIVVHVAAPVDDVDESVAALRLSLGAAIPAVTLVLAGLVWCLVGRTLRPVEAIRREVATITGADLHRRVPEPRAADEVRALAVTMNAMLERVDRAADSQRRFVADASHELRGPLARVRTELEVDLAHPATADPAATHRRVLGEAEHMQRLVEDLLVLARHDDDPARRAGGGPVDLDAVVEEAIARLPARPGVTVDARAVSGAQVDGDTAALGRLVANLLGNALRHAHSTVTVTLAEAGATAVLTVADDGPGIPPAERERVFERFARLDEARSGDAGGTGLGLAIARTIADQHGGSVAVDPGHHPGALLVVRLPVAGAGTGSVRADQQP